MKRLSLSLGALLLIAIAGCSGDRPRPRPELNGLLRQSVRSRRDPSLAQVWLASLGKRGGRERIELIDLRNRRPVPLPGLNRADSQPISLSLSGDGSRIAVVQQREDRTELFLYRRNAAALQRIPLDPPGVPRSVSLDSSGRLLAVQVSRNGRWDVDLIRLP